MSKEVIKNEELDEDIEVTVEEEETDETESETKMDKFKAGLKKYGKKIAIGAGIVAIGIAGFILGKKSSSGDDYDETLEIGYDPNNDVVHDDDSGDGNETE